MAPGPEVGLLIPGSRPWAEALEWAGRAGAAGAERIWLGPDPAEGPSLVLAGALARRVPVRIGVVVPTGVAAPAILAKHLNSLDVVAGGRLDVALDGHDSMDETAAILRALAPGLPHALAEGAPEAVARPAALQQPAYPLWRVVPGPDAARRQGAPTGMPTGWLEAGLELVTVEAW